MSSTRSASGRCSPGHTDFSRMYPRHPDLDYVAYRVGMASFKQASKYVGRDWTHTAHAAETGFGKRFPESEYVDEVEQLFQACRERLARRRSGSLGSTSVGAWRRCSAPMACSTSTRSYKHLPKAISLFGEASAWEGRNDEADGAVERLRQDDLEAADKLAKEGGTNQGQGQQANR